MTAIVISSIAAGLGIWTIILVFATIRLSEKWKKFIRIYSERISQLLPIPDKFSGLKSLMLQYLQSAANRKDDAEIEDDTDLYGRKILDYIWKYDEKQKEQKPIQTDAEKEYVRTLKSLVADFVRANNYIEKGYYQQIYDWLDGRHTDGKVELTPKQDYSGLTDLERVIHRGFLCAGVENAPVTLIKETAQECLAQMQSTVWSDEDEEMLSSVEQWLHEVEPQYVEKELSWLECLPERFNPQPKQEWSEEDKLMIQCCFQAVKSYGYNAKRGEFLPAQFNIGGYLTTPKKVTDWLKSLPERFNPQPKQEVTDEEIEEMVTKRSRSSGTTKSEMAFYRNGIKDAIKRFGLRPSWKPSEEQMEKKSGVKEEPEYYQHFDPDC